jgi:ribosome recycling factor
MDLDEVLFDAEERMEKAADILAKELRTVRTGRASPALVEHLRVEYYGAHSELRQIANIAVPEATLIVIRPYDASAVKDIEKAILTSEIGLTPNSDGKIIRLNVPPLSGERRRQLSTQVRQMAETAKVAIRNVRRDANKAIEQLEKDSAITEDDRDKAKDDVQELTKQYEAKVDDATEAKSKEIMEE